MHVNSPAAASPADGRQSETALAIARGTARYLHALGYCVVSELPLPSGRRADLVALGGAENSSSSRSNRQLRISAPTKSGWTTGYIATGCFSPPSRTFRERFFRPTPD
jgi:hypothetical protein